MIKNLTQDEFLIYCLLFAEEEDFNFTKRDLIEMMSNIEPQDFMKVYNRFVMETESERLQVIEQHKLLYVNESSDKILFFDRFKKMFFYEERFSSVADEAVKLLDVLL